MKIKPNEIVETFEIVQITETKGLTITVEVFKVAEGYRCFARNSHLHHEDLLGAGFHEDKQKSIDLAIWDLRELMAKFNQTLH